mgnify:CR=1 FL=1
MAVHNVDEILWLEGQLRRALEREEFELLYQPKIELSTGRVIGADFALDPSEAALVNGTLAHADETDDSHAAAGMHPGCAILPPAFATLVGKGATAAAVGVTMLIVSAAGMAVARYL